MDRKDIEILKETLKIADSIFTEYCDILNIYVLSNEEIKNITDIEEKQEAKEFQRIDELFKKASKILKIER